MTEYATDVTERRAFDVDDSYEVRLRLGNKDRIEITSEDASFTVTIQNDGHGRAEISVCEGLATLYM